MDYDNTSTETQDDELQKSYIIKQFESILDKIGEGYGEPLQNELIRRMEKTIEEFHNDITDLISQLQDQREKRQNTLKNMLEGDDQSQLETKSSPAEEKEMSSYERRIEEKDSSKNQSESNEQKSEKRGFFARKKK